MDRLFSIISPCYNGAKYLVGYLNSVLEQSYSNIELILVNDASTDNSLQIATSYIKKFEERGYKLIIASLEQNSGQAAAINRGLMLFKGDFMMWMDSDDILLPNAISEKVNFLETGDYDFVLNQGYVVNEKNINTPIRCLKRTKPKQEDNLFKDLILENNVVFAPGAICVRSASLKKAIPSMHIYESREGQNWQLMLPLAFTCKYGYIDKPLFKYVIHNDSHSRTKRNYIQTTQRYDNFIALLFNTIDNIETMDSEEKIYWKDVALVHQLRKKLNSTIKYHKYSDYKKIKKELNKKGYKLAFKENYYIWHIYKIVKFPVKILRLVYRKIFKF